MIELSSGRVAENTGWQGEIIVELVVVAGDVYDFTARLSDNSFNIMDLGLKITILVVFWTRRDIGGGLEQDFPTGETVVLGEDLVFCALNNETSGS